ncbi:MAG: ABC transporter substrate-binding protein [Alphaproteobacteria bacterium]|nr:MAG: ABC transporter substrate-binding protein [Alphaproteobacteria bacterium]
MHLRLYENYRFILYMPFYAAHTIGAYAAEGLTVDLLPSPGVGLAEQALLDGTAEVIWAGPMRVMKHHDDNPGSALVCFAEIVCRDPFSIIGRYPCSDFRLADLARMRIATVRCRPRDFTCRRICDRLGSTPRSSIALPITASPRISWRCARAE